MIALILSGALWCLFIVYIERSEIIYELRLALATREIWMRFERQSFSHFF